MTTKIIFNLLLIGAMSLIACKKNKEVSADALPNEDNIIVKSVLSEAKTNMKTVVPAYAYNDLDWDNAVVEKKAESGMVAIVKSRKNAMDSLVYLSVGNMRMYEWAGQVHTLYKK